MSLRDELAEVRADRARLADEVSRLRSTLRVIEAAARTGIARGISEGAAVWRQTLERIAGTKGG